MIALLLLSACILSFIAGAWFAVWLQADEIDALQEALDGECARSGLLESRLTDMQLKRVLSNQRSRTPGSSSTTTHFVPPNGYT